MKGNEIQDACVWGTNNDNVEVNAILSRNSTAYYTGLQGRLTNDYRDKFRCLFEMAGSSAVYFNPIGFRT